MPNFELINKLLLLYFIQRAEKYGGIFGDIMLQKLVFLSERNMLERNLRGFTYTFIRLIYGPFSQELDADKAKMGQAGLIDYSAEKGCFVSEKGARVLNIFSAVLERNKQFTKIIDNTIRKFIAYPLDKLLAYIYGLPRGIRGDNRNIGILPLKTIILAKPRGKKYIDFNIKNNELWELGFWLDPEIINIKETYIGNHRVLLLRYKNDKYWSAVVPSLPGCVSQGRSIEEVKANISEAIEAYMEEN